MATPTASIRLKRLRQRFGINAPKLAIRTHVAWYWRVLAAIAVLSLSLAIAGWIYDAGRRFAGFDIQESSREITSLRERLLGLEDELVRLRSVAGTGDSVRLIEKSTRQQLAVQIKTLEAENAALKEDLAFFEGLVPATEMGGESGIRINRLRVEPETVDGQYRYRMLLVNNAGSAAKNFSGSLQLLVRVQVAGKDAIITVPPELQQDLRGFQFEIKRFQRAEGVFSVPPGSVVKSVEARLLQGGSVRARQSVTF